jgi:hypothetical protein
VGPAYIIRLQILRLKLRSYPRDQSQKGMRHDHGTSDHEVTRMRVMELGG